jgi:hypothetical protein
MKNRMWIVGLMLITILVSSCAHRDCLGRKKTAKTDMGGWL